MKKTNTTCPVPLEQQPIYEYEMLKNSPFFFWTTENDKKYFKQICIFLGLNLLLSGLFIKMLNITQANIILNLMYTIVVASCTSGLVLFGLYLGWKHIYIRLKDPIITYEESGWYDGQIWIKTPEILLKDTITADYIILPILTRIKITISCLLGCFILSFLNVK